MTTTPEFPDLKRPRVTPSMVTYPPPSADPLRCPRCNSTQTKFCYYNNYNLSQPRHFCKNCRRYWTQGGTLRNVPVGGGTRKKPRRSHRASPSNFSSSPSSSSLTHETKLTSDSAVEKPDLSSNQTQQQQKLQLLNPSNNVPGLSFSSMTMNSQEQPGFLSLGGYEYVYGSGYGSGYVHEFQQGYGYVARAPGLDLPAEIVYGAPVATSSGLEMNTWQMAFAFHGGQDGGLVDLPDVQILNSMPPVKGGALKEEKVADSSTSSCLDFPAY